MHRLIGAAAAVVLSGLFGAMTLGTPDAQERRPGPEPAPMPHPGFPPPNQPERGPAPMPMQANRPPAQAGTWQIVTNRDLTILLNTATGETFHLAEKDGHLHWRPIERPAPRTEMPAMPRVREMPGLPPMPERPAQPDRPNAERLRKALEEARSRLKNAEGEERDTLKRRIAEVERMLQELEKPRGDDRGGDIEEMENLGRRLKEKIRALEDKLEDTDDKAHRKELEKALDELRADAKRIAQELETARKQQKERGNRNKD